MPFISETGLHYSKQFVKHDCVDASWLLLLSFLGTCCNKNEYGVFFCLTVQLLNNVSIW